MQARAVWLLRGDMRRRPLAFAPALTLLPFCVRQGQTMNAGAMLLRRPRRMGCARGATVASAAPPKRRVVVTGLGCVTSLGHDKTTFYKCVCAAGSRRVFGACS